MNKDIDDLIAEFVADGGNVHGWKPSWSIAPSTPVPIVRSWHDHDTDEIHRELTMARWGIQPSWAKPTGPKPINARLETVATNGMFRSSFTSQRCIVPMDPGYYEWKEFPDGKQPYLIHGDGILAAAGIYATRQVDDQWQHTFTIITREARDRSGEIHDRMPVFISADMWDEWLDPTPLNGPKKTDPDRRPDTITMLENVSASVAATLDTHPVSRQLNNVRTVARYDPATAELISFTT